VRISNENTLARWNQNPTHRKFSKVSSILILYSKCSSKVNFQKLYQENIVLAVGIKVQRIPNSQKAPRYWICYTDYRATFDFFQLYTKNTKKINSKIHLPLFITRVSARAATCVLFDMSNCRHVCRHVLRATCLTVYTHVYCSNSNMFMRIADFWL